MGILIIALALVGFAAAASDTANEHVIQTTGTGNVIGTPDRAQVTFSVQTENTDVKSAQAENAIRMAKVHDALLAIGIPKDALKTTGYNIYPVYEDSNGILKPKIKTYRVTNSLTVTLHNVSQTGDVIDTAVANGINQADSIQFMLSDEQAAGPADRSPERGSLPGKVRCRHHLCRHGDNHYRCPAGRDRQQLFPGLLPELCYGWGSEEYGRSNSHPGWRYHGLGLGNHLLHHQLIHRILFHNFFKIAA